MFAIMKKRLKAEPPRNLEGLKAEVIMVWRGLPDAEMCAAIIRNIEYLTKYLMFFVINIFLLQTLFSVVILQKLDNDA